MTKVIESLVSFDENADGLFVKHQQEIPQWWLDDIAAQRNASSEGPMGEFVRVASIPTAVVDRWDREGYKIEEHSLQETLAKLSAEDMSKFRTNARSF